MRYSFYNTAQKFYRYYTDILSSHFKDLDITSIIAFRKFENDNFHNYTMIDDVDDNMINLTFRKDDPTFQLDVKDHRDIDALINNELQSGKRHLADHIKDRYPESEVKEKLSRATDIYNQILNYLGSYLTKADSQDLTFDSSFSMSFESDEKQLLNDINISIPLPMPKLFDRRWPHLRRDFYVTSGQGNKNAENDFFNAWRFDNAVEAFIDNQSSMLNVALWEKFAALPTPCDPGKIQDVSLGKAVINKTNVIKVPGLRELAKALIEMRLIGESRPSDSLFIPIYENGFFGGLIGVKLFEIGDGESVKRVLRKILATSTELANELSNAREVLARSYFVEHLYLEKKQDLIRFAEHLKIIQPIKSTWMDNDHRPRKLFFTYHDYCNLEKDCSIECSEKYQCRRIVIDCFNSEIDVLPNHESVPQSQISQIERLMRFNEELRVRSQAEWEWLSEALAHSIKAPANIIVGGLNTVKSAERSEKTVQVKIEDIESYIENGKEILQFVDLISGLQDLQSKNQDELYNEMAKNQKSVRQLAGILKDSIKTISEYAQNASEAAQFDRFAFEKRPLAVEIKDVGENSRVFFHENICKLVIKESLINMFRHSKEGRMFIQITHSDDNTQQGISLSFKNRISRGARYISKEDFHEITQGRFARQVSRTVLAIFLNHFLLNILLGEYIRYTMYTIKDGNEIWQTTEIQFLIVI